ncbi:MAG: response regulator [Bdellovibrionota bacterium]
MTQAMIVDSSELWASELKAHLEKLGLQVASWQTKGTGWTESLKNTSIKWIFVDDQLPSRSGLKCIEKLHEARVFGGHIVFMHSIQGAAAAQLELSAFMWGARFVLRKPFRLAELRKIIEQITPIARPHDP